MADQFKNLPDIATIQPDRLIKYRLSEERFSAEVLLPGLWYTDFDKKIGGKWSLWSIAKLCESIRYHSLMQGLALYGKFCHGKDNTMFLACQSWDITKCVHDIRYSSMYGTKYGLKAVLSISQLGKTSFTILGDLYEHSSGEKLLSFMTKLVHISTLTRKPIPFPAEMIQQSREHINRTVIQTIEKIQIPVIPPNAYQYHIKALHSDCDGNMHVNQSTYLKWCSDAASEAALSGYFSYLKKQIECYPFSNIEVHYIGEALANDKVTINAWENARNPKLLHFGIVRNKQMIYIANIGFHGGPPIEISWHVESRI